MIRRDFFKRVLAAVAAVCGGAEKLPALPRRQQTRDVTILRVDETAWTPPRTGRRFYRPGRDKLTQIDWFDMKPGDTVVVWYKSGGHEKWQVSGAPFWNTSGPTPVEGVPISKSWRLSADDTWVEESAADG